MSITTLNLYFMGMFLVILLSFFMEGIGEPKVKSYLESQWKRVKEEKPSFFWFYCFEFFPYSLFINLTGYTFLFLIILSFIVKREV